MNIKFLIILSLIVCVNSIAFGQISTSSSGARVIPPDQTEEIKVNQIITDSGNLFKEALMNLQDGRRSQARDKFDKSVEVFLNSSVNIISNAKLKGCYDQLVETVYRLEFPTSNGHPQIIIKNLARTCGWSIDGALADNVARVTLIASKNTGSLTDKNKESAQAVLGNQAEQSNIGFAEQRFEKNALDELSRLELTSEDLLKGLPVSNNKICPMPVLQKITLGKTVAETEKILGRKLNFQNDYKAGDGVRVAFFKSPMTKFIGIRTYKNLIYDVSVIYDNSITWSGLVDFALTAARSLEIAVPWSFRPAEAVISCTDFTLSALRSQQNYALNVRDKRIAAQIKFDAAVRMRKVEIENQKKKAAFKP